MAYYGGGSSGESSGGTTTDTTAPFFSQTNVIGTTTNTSPTITINSNENGILTGTISSTNGTYTTFPLYRHYQEDLKLFGNFKSFEIYNNNVRTRNEMFIPLKFYEDLLLPTNLATPEIFYDDPNFPTPPVGVVFEEPLKSIGPDANWVRNPNKWYF